MENLAVSVLESFRSAGQSLAVCETSAGGKLTARLLEVPGSSSTSKLG
jgi:nicotinamide mononucleotide (NMN) deamidase PncC